VTQTPSQILGPDGKPWRANGEMKKRYGSGSGSFIRSLLTANQDPTLRAREPFTSHGYVMAAARAIALNLSQVELCVFEERESVQQSRATQAVRRGMISSTRHFVGSFGKKRSFFARYNKQSNESRSFSVRRSVEINYDHPVSQLIRNPNDLISTSNDLVYAICLYMSLRGEAPLLPIMNSGERWRPGLIPDQLQTLHPDSLRERVDARGNLQFWEYNVTPRDDGYGRGTSLVRFAPDEIIIPKFFNPSYPLRGVSPIAAAAMGITQDIMAQQHTSSMLTNGAEPTGVLEAPSTVTPEQQADLETMWAAKYGGARNAYRTLILENGMKFSPLGLSPSDMQYIESRKWNREEILAVMGVPKSILSVDENLNYSIQLSQDRNFFNKTLIPLARSIEAAFDQSLMYGESDTQGLMFDLSSVEALQGEVGLKTDTAIKLMTKGRLSTRDSYELVGLNVPDMEHGDEVLVEGLLSPISDLVEGFSPSYTPPEDEGDSTEPQSPSPTDGPDGDQELDPDSDEESPEEPATPRTTKALRVRGFTGLSFRTRAARNAVKLQQVYQKRSQLHERAFALMYAAHLRSLRRETIKSLTEANKGFASDRKVVRAIDIGDIGDILFDLKSTHSKLRRKSLPIYEQMGDDAISMTQEELNGLFVFEVDDPRVLNVVKNRVTKVTGLNVRLRKRLSQVMRETIQDGETFDELKRRINRTFNSRLSPSRLTTVARTETAQTISPMHDAILDIEGIDRHLWTTAGDEVVRVDHAEFGSLGPQERGTNFMELIGKPGTLRFPSDPDGPVEQIVNCRCFAVATA
jgi:HK97 family phage portal protein